MIDILNTKIELEIMYQEALNITDYYVAKYGFNEKGLVENAPEIMTIDDRIDYEINRNTRYILYGIMDKFINNYMTPEEKEDCRIIIRDKYNY